MQLFKKKLNHNNNSVKKQKNISKEKLKTTKQRAKSVFRSYYKEKENKQLINTNYVNETKQKLNDLELKVPNNNNI